MLFCLKKDETVLLYDARNSNHNRIFTKEVPKTLPSSVYDIDTKKVYNIEQKQSSILNLNQNTASDNFYNYLLSTNTVQEWKAKENVFKTFANLMSASSDSDSLYHSRTKKNDMEDLVRNIFTPQPQHLFVPTGLSNFSDKFREQTCSCGRLATCEAMGRQVCNNCYQKCMESAGGAVYSVDFRGQPITSLSDAFSALRQNLFDFFYLMEKLVYYFHVVLQVVGSIELFIDIRKYSIIIVDKCKEQVI
jgi:hypothetical protein